MVYETELDRENTDSNNLFYVVCISYSNVYNF